MFWLLVVVVVKSGLTMGWKIDLIGWRTVRLYGDYSRIVSRQDTGSPVVSEHGIEQSRLGPGLLAVPTIP